MNISGSQILVTGGAGFIGSNLSRRLVRLGGIVTIFDSFLHPYGANLNNLKDIKHKIHLVKGDIRNINELKSVIRGKDYIFHLAAQTGRTISMEDPLLDAQINCIGTLNIIKLIKKEKNKPKIIFAGSRGVMGKAKKFPVREGDKEYPVDVYGINKLTAERYVLVLGREYGFPAVSLRLNNVYGPRCQIKSNHYGTVNLFISYALRKKTIPIYGSGKQSRDYIYVDDVVDAFISSLKKEADFKTFFVGLGKPISLLKIISIIKFFIPDLNYKKVPYPKNLKDIDFPLFYSDSNFIQKKLGWKPKTDIHEGIKKTIEFYRKEIKNYF